MPAFSHFIRDRKPLRTVVIGPTCWADDAPDRPKEPVAIGLRLLSEQDLQIAKSQAARYAVQLYPNEELTAVETQARYEAFEDALLRWAVGRGTCDPNDTERSYFEHEEDSVRRSLTSGGVRRLWDELERLHLEESPILPMASDDEIRSLGERLVGGNLTTKTPARMQRVRRLLRFVLEELTPGDEQ